MDGKSQRYRLLALYLRTYQKRESSDHHEYRLRRQDRKMTRMDGQMIS